MSKLYFAYGSNCHTDSMKKRCVNAIPVGTSKIYGWALRTFNHSTIVPNSDKTVEGVVWLISPEDEERLDYYEGYPVYYTKETVETDYGDATVYVMKPEYYDGFPSEYYSNIVAEAYSQWDIPYEQYIRSLGPELNVLTWTRQSNKEKYNEYSL